MRKTKGRLSSSCKGWQVIPAQENKGIEHAVGVWPPYRENAFRFMCTTYGFGPIVLVGKLFTRGKDPAELNPDARGRGLENNRAVRAW